MSGQTTTTETTSNDYSLGTRFLEFAAGVGLVALTVVSLPVVGTIGGVVGTLGGLGIAVDGVRGMMNRNQPDGDDEDDELNISLSDDEETDKPQSPQNITISSQSPEKIVSNDPPVTSSENDPVSNVDDTIGKDVKQGESTSGNDTQPKPLDVQPTTTNQTPKDQPTEQQIEVPQQKVELTTTTTQSQPKDTTTTRQEPKPKPPRDEPEPIKVLREELKTANSDAVKYFRSLLKYETEIAQKLLDDREPTLRKNALSALKVQDEQASRAAIDLYKQAIQETKDAIPALARARVKWKRQLDDEDIKFWQDLADIDASYADANKQCVDAVKDAKLALGKQKDDGPLKQVERLDGMRKVAFTQVQNWQEDGKWARDLIHQSEADAGTEGSLAWFDTLRQQIEALGTPAQQNLQPTQAQLDWNAVEADVQLKYNAFKNSTFNYSNGNLRGPSMPPNLRTDNVVTIYFLSGKRYRIGGKIYEVGPSDTGGMSLKTEFPKRYQGYNNSGGWVKSFIYHLNATH